MPVRPSHHEGFSVAMAETLREKGYCVVQAIASPVLRKNVVSAVDRCEDFTIPKQEFEEAFLGRTPKSKIAWLTSSLADQPALAHYYQTITDLGNSISAISKELLGYAL